MASPSKFWRKVRTKFFLAASVALLAVLPGIAAAAIEVRCVEASRYKYLYGIFGNDYRRFAQFVGLDERSLPHPESCRAMLLTEKIEAPERGQSSDFDTLLNAVRQNNGSFATLYLASPGGSIGMGFRLGYLTRMFWLKTHAVEGQSFEYIPDFFSDPSGAVDVPPELQPAWNGYLQATQAFRHTPLGPDGKRRRCVSACTFIHAAGIQRYGTSYFHRGRSGRRKPQSGPPGGDPSGPSISQMMENLHKAEQRMIAFYRQMDAGDEAIRVFQATATQTSAPAAMAFMPRYLDDYMRGACRAPPPRRAPNMPPGGSPNGPGTYAPAVPAPSLSELDPQMQYRPPGPAMPQPARQEPQQANPRAFADCVTATHERERFKQFAKLCPQGCDPRGLLSETVKRMRTLLPEDATRPAREPQQNPRGYPRQGYDPPRQPPRGGNPYPPPYPYQPPGSQPYPPRNPNY